MPELKTKQTVFPVEQFLGALTDKGMRDDCRVIDALMAKVTGHQAKMWGTSIIGYGSYHYKYASGHEGDMCLTGFSPRKSNITLYLWPEEDLVKKLGKHKAGKGCIYIKRLDDVDLKVLEKLITATVKKSKDAHTE
jgi:Domain of unknown function (DU1801)